MALEAGHALICVGGSGEGRWVPAVDLIVEGREASASCCDFRLSSGSGPYLRVIVYTNELG